MSTSTTHDARPMASNEPVTTASPKRLSRLNDFMSRSRTSSLPVRPQSSSGVQSSTSRQKINQKIHSFKGKGKDKGDTEEATSRKAASSTVSVVDPFAANPTASSSFVTFSPTSTPTAFSPPRKLPAPLNMRTQTANSDETESIMSQPRSPTSPTPATQSFSPPARRRGSILVAASDALSSFARKAPMRSLHLNMGGMGRTNSTKSFVNATQPIVLTEVIEISESAVRASKRREEEEAERERLREAAARALGINDKDGETSSMNSRQRSGGLLDFEESGEEEDAGNGEYRGWGDDSITPTATSLPSLATGPSHSRTRSSSYIPPHTIGSLPPRSPTPLSTFSSQHASQAHSTLVSNHPQTPKSFSTPPSSVAPTLRINTFNPSKLYPDDTPSCPVPEIPPFPSTPAALSPFTQLSGTMPRYYPAPSLLMFTLTKQWKNRYLVFTTPLTSPSSQKSVFRSPWSSNADSTNTTTPVPSYLHLFKTSGAEEKEIERLEINEESVVYVAEGEVGGRKGVIKIGGSLKKKPSTARRPSTSGTATSTNAPTTSSRTSSSSMGSADEHPTEGGVLTNFENTSSTSSAGQGLEGRTMWVLQVTDAEEAQEWIGAIKGAVLNQRSIRAGLGMPTVVNGMEPRGDLDVVLSMRAQGLFPSPTVPHVDYQGMNGSATIRSQGPISPTKSTFTGESGGHASPVGQLSRSQSVTASTGYSSTTPSMTSWETGSTNATSLSNGSSSPIPRATTALKSLFTIGGGRPRSPSTSSLTPPASALEGEERPEDSFGNAGASLMGMGMNRSNSYVNDGPASPNTPTLPNTPRAGTPIIPPEAFLERKILPDPDRQLLENEVTSDLPSIKKTSPSGLGFGRPREASDRHSVPIRVSSDGITSIALQPPPRKRAGTVNSTTLSVSVSSPTDSSPATPTYTYSHTNTSTAESLGVSMGVKSSNLLTPPLPTTPTSAGISNVNGKRRVTRASWSSVSTYGSGEQPSSPDESRPRRWSRRSSVPHRMSPPYPSMSSPPSSPLMQDRLTPPIRHPYASESVSLSRSSSIGSGHSRVSELHTRPFSSKRASIVSIQTSSTTSTQHSYPASANKPVFAAGRPKSAHRASLPPPQRPAPNSALPPTPSENGHAGPAMAVTQSLPAPRTLRESLTLRGNKRLSTSPPTQPPASALPPRPDEPGYHRPVYNHRRSSSSGNPTSPLVPTDSMPTSAIQVQAPTLPPSSPLPTPPRPHTANAATPSRSTSLIRRRIRILSSPPSAPPSAAPSRPPIDEYADHLVGVGAISIPESPIIPGPITILQNDPSFLRMSPQTPDDDLLLDAAPQGLSPPPRRGSRQIATPEKEKLQDEVGPSESTDSGDGESSSDVKEPDSPAPVPPPELDAFPPLSAPAVRSSEYSAVSLVDVRI